MCKTVCTKEEYEQLKKAFFEKEKNLEQIQMTNPKSNNTDVYSDMKKNNDIIKI